MGEFCELTSKFNNGVQHNIKKRNQVEWSLTGTAEGDGTGIHADDDGRRRLDVEDDEGSGGSQLEVVESPPESVHALLAAVHGHDHTAQVTSSH